MSSPKLEVPSRYTCPSGEFIETQPSTRDLGIIMSESATFNLQIDDVVKRGTRQAAWVLRTFYCRDARVMLTLFKSLVLPILEYCCQVWSPVTLGKIRSLESVQRNFTSKIAGMKDFNYWDRLLHLKLYSLERRRERYIIIYIFKVILGLSPNFDNHSYAISTFVSERRGLLCRVPSLNKKALGRFKTMKDESLAVRGPLLFNSIPTEIRNLNLSVDSFKSKLDGFLSGVPDKPSLQNYFQVSKNNSITEQIRVLRRN